jgi:hypothetical protein
MSRDNPPTPTPQSALEVCPGCQSRRIKRSASTLKHVARLLLRSPKRYCPDCKKRWTVTER